ncbi:MAG: hypothetical protein JW917_06175 [Ignavibacteria bacterium]|nr:hypothetical protein [Ignavibacteria bacterium]
MAVIEGRGSEVIDFLNRISSNQLKTLKPGQNAGTIFLNDKGRIIGFAKIINDFERILINTEKGTEKVISEHLEKYIFNDDVKLTLLESEHSETYIFYEDINEYIEFRNEIIKNYSGKRNFFYYTDSLYGNTFNILIKREELHHIFEYLKDYKKADEGMIEYYRIINKIPKYPNEINDTFNPLECGLEKYISLDKGCYTGQEVLARIDSRKKLPKSLKVFKTSTKPGDKGIIYFAQDEKETEVGIITSVTEYKNEIFCLGFIRTIYFSDENEYYVIKNKEKIKLILIN